MFQGRARALAVILIWLCGGRCSGCFRFYWLRRERGFSFLGDGESVGVVLAFGSLVSRGGWCCFGFGRGVVWY